MPASAAVLHRWSDLPFDSPLPLIERRRVIGQQMMLSHVTLRRGFRVSMHQHENEQFTAMLSGRLRFRIASSNGTPPRELIIVSGDVLEIPANVPHEAEALEDSVLLDLFSPPSEKTGVDRT
jgi:quercetin dioxygenase-like cupin family protein